jgi:4a-hydroxytetrahydrobiopterin dehydratase
MNAGPEIVPTDPTGRSGGGDHRPFKDLARGDRNITFGFASVKCGRRLTRGASNMIEALASKTCTPCRGGIPPLTREQAELFHAQALDWQLSEEAHRIERSFRFRNFREALTFVREIGELAEAEGHHPNISFGWGYATVSLQTKKIKGLHENDFIMATKIDRIFAGTATA